MDESKEKSPDSIPTPKELSTTDKLFSLFISAVPALLITSIVIKTNGETTSFILFALLPGFIALIYALLTLTPYLYNRYVRQESVELPKYTTPALFIVLAVFILKEVNAYSTTSAHKYAMIIAEEIQKECKTNKVCPEELKESPHHNFKGKTKRRVEYTVPYGFTYPIGYYRDRHNTDEFMVYIKQGLGSSYLISGGANKELKDGMTVD